MDMNKPVLMNGDCKEWKRQNNTKLTIFTDLSLFCYKAKVN